MVKYSDSREEPRTRWDLAASAFFVVLALLAVNLPSLVQQRVSETIQATALRPFFFLQTALAQARLRGENTVRLQDQMDSLASVVAAQTTLAEENRRLRELLEMEPRDPLQFVHANAIRSGTAGSESMFLLDVGSEDGVEEGDAVLVRHGKVGLVGVIQGVNPNTSMALDWSHPDFRASAMSKDGLVYGLVAAVRGRFREEDRLLLNGVPFYDDLAPGTLITTSGLGGVFPRGLPIGNVLEKFDDEGGWRKSYWIRPVSETGSITHVLVLVGDSLPGLVTPPSDSGEVEEGGGGG